MLYHCKKCGWKGEVKTRPRCLQCCARRATEWRKANPDLYRARSRIYAVRHDKKFRMERPEEYRAKRRKYYLPLTAKAMRNRRIEWLKSGNVTREDLREIYKLYNGKCVYCGIDVKPRYTPFDPRGFDHVKARAKGGKHEKSNIVVCCRTCNELKK